VEKGSGLAEVHEVECWKKFNIPHDGGEDGSFSCKCRTF
jgi:hypothetical protein